MPYTLIEDGAPKGGYTLLPDDARPPMSRADMIRKGALPGLIDYFSKPENRQVLADNFKRDLPGMASSLANGATLGYADELVGVVSPQGKQAMRDAAEDYKQRFPMRSAALNIVGGLPTGLGMARGLSSVIPAFKSTAAQLGLGAGVGGVTGAVQGYGENTDPSRALGEVGVSAAMGAALPLGLSAAGGVIRQGVARFVPEQAKQWAQEKIAQGFARDGITGQQAATRLGALGPEARVVDAGRDSTRQLLDTLATAPGQTKANVASAIAERQKSRGARMQDAASDALDVTGFRLRPEMEGWIADRAAKADPLYERLRQVTIQPNPKLMSIVEAADRLGATAKGKDIATGYRMPWTLDASGKSPMSMRDLDNLKQGMDDLIKREMRTGESGAIEITSAGRAFQALRKDLIEHLDRQTMGLYKQARDAYAGPSAIMDAASAGKNFLLKSGDEIKALRDSLSGSERDAFALGAFEALRDKLGAQGGQTELMKLWRQDNLREKLQAIFGDQKAYQEFARKMYAEKTMAGLEQVGRGSQTAARQQAASDLDSPVASLLDAKSGGAMSAIRGLTSRMGTPEPVRDQMGTFLLSRDPQGLLELDPLIRSINQGRTRQQTQMGVLSGLL